MHKSEIVGRGKIGDALYTNNSNIAISKSPFSAFESNEDDELVFKGKTNYANIENITLQVNMGYLRIKDDDTIDLEILKALDELEFAISRMVTWYLNLKGIEIHQEKVSKRLKYMNRLKIISSYELRSKDKNGNERQNHTSIYYLDTGSIFIFKSQDIKPSFKPETAIKSKNGIKEILSRNQLMLTYVENIKNVNYTKNSPTYKLANGDEYKPHLQIVFDYEGNQQHMFFEVVRSYNGWQEKTLSRLDKCKSFIESFKPSSTIPRVPIVVMVAEDDKHSYDIMKTIIDNNLLIKDYTYFFTTDNRVLTSQIDKSIVKVVVEDNNPSIVVLTIRLFEL